MSNIEPALTPEEWRETNTATVGCYELDGSRYVHTWTDAAVSEPRDIVALIALANHALPDGDPRKLRREHVTALEDAFMKLHGPKMDAPRNDTERGLLRLSEILTSLLP